jgi:hypothetical protein
MNQKAEFEFSLMPLSTPANLEGLCLLYVI